ncbi:MAG: hypothetical protein M3R15_15645 [Acidobacteriota bacterium]|nr:hypothetical protein [Acidobacteriota bacterium]
MFIARILAAHAFDGNRVRFIQHGVIKDDRTRRRRRVAGRPQCPRERDLVHLLWERPRGQPGAFSRREILGDHPGAELE